MYHPLHNNVLILGLSDPDTWIPGGKLVLPDTQKSRSDQGFVKATGPDCVTVKTGHYVLFEPWSGKVIDDSVEGKKLIMLPETAILAIVTVKEKLLDVWDAFGKQLNSTDVSLLLRTAFEGESRLVRTENRIIP